MTKEQKDLLIKDLSARLPYGVKGIITFNGDKDIFTVKGVFNILFLSDTECCHIEDFKPYLRPMSSMTEEQEIEYDATFETIVYENGRKDSVMTYKSFDWLNKNYFDYRGLIPIGLAKDCTNLNIY